MIQNERQYRITRTQIEKFNQALRHLEAHPEESLHLSPRLRQAERDALTSLLESLNAERAEYETLRAGRINVFKADSLESLPQALVKARIAQGMTQKDLAERLGLKEQQIQRYEATNYASASMTRVQEVARALNATLTHRVSLRNLS